METQLIRHMSNNCTLVAVKEVTHKTDEEIFTAFRNNGYRDHKGMSNHRWIKAAQELGCEMEEVEVLKTAFKKDNPLRFQTSYNNWSERYMTLAEFIKEFPSGVFFITVSGHALVVRDGKVVDHNRRINCGLRRRVRIAYQVLNAPKIEKKFSNTVKFCVVQPKRWGTAAYERYKEARNYANTNENCTPEMLFANTSYTKSDFSYDMKRNHIAFKEI